LEHARFLIIIEVVIVVFLLLMLFVLLVIVTIIFMFLPLYFFVIYVVVSDIAVWTIMGLLNISLGLLFLVICMVSRGIIDTLLNKQIFEVLKGRMAL
jgi:hypothetical protein